MVVGLPGFHHFQKRGFIGRKHTSAESRSRSGQAFPFLLRFPCHGCREKTRLVSSIAPRKGWWSHWGSWSWATPRHLGMLQLWMATGALSMTIPKSTELSINPRNLQRSDPRFTDPEKTWVSIMSRNLLGPGSVGIRSHLVFDGINDNSSITTMPCSFLSLFPWISRALKHGKSALFFSWDGNKHPIP